ncbi:MAG: ImmA/IrrE family metallo-endopeptidase [Methanobrevibacter sp.]|nr:ImmA/IrrE family metallo-endopeptidase [Methanobrevibacter sp.]
MINDFILDVCDYMGIDPPELSYNTDHFSSDTMIAQCSPDGSTIFVKPYEKRPTMDHYFAIAHELRHVWQIRTDKNKYMADYKPVSLCGSIEEYNLQPAEIDANAFAAAVMMDAFGVKPLFENQSEKVKSEIWDRVKCFFGR